MRLMRLVRRQSGGERSHSHGDGRLMQALVEHPGSSAREIAERMDIRPSSLSEKLDRLEARGDVERLRDADDSRVVRLRLTQRGLAEAERSAEQARRARASLDECLTDEEKRLFCGLCEKLCGHLAKETASPSDCGGHRHGHRH